MEKRKKLAQIASQALLLALALPAGAVAHEDGKAHTETLLAAKSCGGGGCGAKNVSYNAPSNNPYNASTNTYQADSSRPYGTADYNTNRGYNTSPTYTDSYRTDTYRTDTYRTDASADYSQPRGMTQINELDFARQLDSRHKAIFQSFDLESKKEALRLAASGNTDFNSIVDTVQQRQPSGARSSYSTGATAPRTGTSGYSGGYNTGTSTYDSSSSSDWNR